MFHEATPPAVAPAVNLPRPRPRQSPRPSITSQAPPRPVNLPRPRPPQSPPGRQSSPPAPLHRPGRQSSPEVSAPLRPVNHRPGPAPALSITARPRPRSPPPPPPRTREPRSRRCLSRAALPGPPVTHFRFRSGTSATELADALPPPAAASSARCQLRRPGFCPQPRTSASGPVPEGRRPLTRFRRPLPAPRPWLQPTLTHFRFRPLGFFAVSARMSLPAASAPVPPWNFGPGHALPVPAAAAHFPSLSPELFKSRGRTSGSDFSLARFPDSVSGPSLAHFRFRRAGCCVLRTHIRSGNRTSVPGFFSALFPAASSALA